jgi:hypothetical protein
MPNIGSTNSLFKYILWETPHMQIHILYNFNNKGGATYRAVLPVFIQLHQISTSASEACLLKALSE